MHDNLFRLNHEELHRLQYHAAVVPDAIYCIIQLHVYKLEALACMHM